MIRGQEVTLMTFCECKCGYFVFLLGVQYWKSMKWVNTSLDGQINKLQKKGWGLMDKWKNWCRSSHKKEYSTWNVKEFHTWKVMTKWDGRRDAYLSIFLILGSDFRIKKTMLRIMLGILDVLSAAAPHKIAPKEKKSQDRWLGVCSKSGRCRFKARG